MHYVAVILSYIILLFHISYIIKQGILLKRVK